MSEPRTRAEIEREAALLLDENELYSHHNWATVRLNNQRLAELRAEWKAAKA